MSSKIVYGDIGLKQYAVEEMQAKLVLSVHRAAK